MPTRWTFTSASPGPGDAGSAVSITRSCCGWSSEMAFISIVLRETFAVADIFHRREDGLHFAQQLFVDRLGGPFRPVANVVGIGAAGDGRRDVGIGERELERELGNIHALVRAMCRSFARRRFHVL